MKVSEFASLINIWKLVDRDVGQKDLYLTPDRAHVVGVHAEAVRWLDGDALPLGGPMVVNAALISGAVSLMDQDAEIGVKSRNGGGITVAASGRRAVLYFREGDPPDDDPMRIKAKRAPSAKLREGVAFLRSCVEGASTISPVLTGIRFENKGGNLVLVATDGERRSGRARIKGEARGADGQVVPAADLDVALGLLDGDVALRFGAGDVRLADANTSIRLTLLAGDYPAVEKLPKPSQLASTIQIAGDPLRTAVRAAALLDDDRVVQYVIKDGAASWIVRGQETGGFRVPAGRTDNADAALTLAADSLEPATHLGDEIALHYKDERSPLLLTGRGYWLWVMPLLRA